MKLIKILVPTPKDAEAVNELLAKGEEDGALDFPFSVRIVEGEATPEDLMS